MTNRNPTAVFSSPNQKGIPNPTRKVDANCRIEKIPFHYPLERFHPSYHYPFHHPKQEEQHDHHHHPQHYPPPPRAFPSPHPPHPHFYPYPRNHPMEMDNRSSLLERHQKNHRIASLMISNKNKSATDALGTSVRSTSSRSSNDENRNGSNHKGDGNNNNKASGGASTANANGEKKMNTGRWSAEEHKRFLAGLDQFGTGNWKKITDMVGTRSCTQIRTHAQKYFIALQKPANDPNSESGGYSRKKSKMLIGADHHLNSNIKTGSSAIITGYGGGGTPIHPSGIVPVTGTMGTSKRGSNSVPAPAPGPSASGAPASSSSNTMIKQFWTSDGLREGAVSGLTGMEVLAQAAITGEKRSVLSGLSGASGSAPTDTDHILYRRKLPHFQERSSLDQAVAELRKKMEAEKKVPAVTPSSDEITKQASSASSETLSHKRKLEESQAVAAVVSMHHDEAQKKLKLQQQTSEYVAAAVKDTIDRKDVLDKLQAAAERQEHMRLRQEVKTLNQTILQLQQQSIESDNRVMEAITDRRVTLNECKNLREINAQLKAELRRMVLLFEHSSGSGTGGSSSAALMAAATQGANVELMQARLTESELRYHTVTESLSRQTSVLTDQHRAILELNSQLEQERAKRQAVEFELKQIKQEQKQGQRLSTA